MSEWTEPYPINADGAVGSRKWDNESQSWIEVSGTDAAGLANAIAETDAHLAERDRRLEKQDLESLGEEVA